MRPSAHSAEEEYIAREQADREREHVLDGRAETARLAVQERERLKKLHFMRCPQCGGELQAAALHGVDAAQCVECSGIWLDSAEFEQLAGKRTGLLQQLLSAFGGTSRSA
ncbi:MAG TPA: zf-TFIIB domain-containing protein [Polyangiaceae bacterium]